jgi:hypothetical protein
LRNHLLPRRVWIGRDRTALGPSVVFGDTESQSGGADRIERLMCVLACICGRSLRHAPEVLDSKLSGKESLARGFYKFGVPAVKGDRNSPQKTLDGTPGRVLGCTRFPSPTSKKRKLRWPTAIRFCSGSHGALERNLAESQEAYGGGERSERSPPDHSRQACVACSAIATIVSECDPMGSCRENARHRKGASKLAAVQRLEQGASLGETGSRTLLNSASFLISCTASCSDLAGRPAVAPTVN